MYPFGYGLSYTTFAYSNLKVYPDTIQPDGKVTVSVDVKNTGKRDGQDVVQLYLRDVYSSVTTPRKNLKGFSRVSIKAGDTKTVTFELTSDELSLWNRQMKNVVEPGDFVVMVGSNSANLTLKKKFTVIGQ
ncbi:fibronectin type III-like domain-contianing protein [Prolixibacter bellariivorans]|uniref:fibronectin type III-like domain-contianing protein n=1 Tax=Prolixibacter bellariivorans TaxID=314319 RepID=UPI003570AFC4